MNEPISLTNVPRDVRRKAELLDHEFTQILGLKVRPALKALEAKLLIDEETLRRLFYKRWLKLPEGQRVAGVIDHRKCKGCGLPGCTVAREITIPEDTVHHWQAGYMGNDKRAMRESWETRIIGALQRGEEVPGLGTWQQLYLKLHPFGALPMGCPWHIHNAPKGFSFSSFSKHKAADVVYKLAQKGEFAAWSELPEVRVDLSDLKALEYIVFDDHRIDAYCMIETAPGQVQKVEMWGVFAMDVASRKVIAFGLKPRVARDDGSKTGISRRDVQHLVAHILATYGIPKDYPMTLIVENAAAAISTELELMLQRVTRGQVRVKRSGVHSSDAMIAGFPEKWGNYRGKRWIESWFNPFDIAMGIVKGQMGSDYWAKPGRTDAQVRWAEKLCALVGPMSPEERAKFDLPFEWAGDMHRLISAAVEAVDSREDHECAGFEPVRFFRWNSQGDNQPKPMHPGLARLHGTERELEMFSSSPLDLQNMWLSFGFSRPETPKEKFARTYANGARFARVSEETFLHLLCDEETRANKDGKAITYQGGNVLDVLVRQGTKKFTARFGGMDHQLTLGQTVRVVMNMDHLEAGIFIIDEDGRQLGRMHYLADPKHTDTHGIERMLGQKHKALREVAVTMRKVMLKPGEIERQIEAIDTNLEILGTMAEAHDISPALPESRTFVKALKETKTQPRKTGILSAADLLDEDNE